METQDKKLIFTQKFYKMKIKNLFLVFLVLAFVASCSSDDDNISGGGEETPGGEDPVEVIDYLPSDVSNNWTYFNEIESGIEELEGTSTETLSVTDENDNIVTFNTEVDGETRGLFTGALANGEIEKVEGSLVYSGDMNLFDFEGIDLDIPFSEMLILDVEAAEGDELFSVEGEFSEELPFGEFGDFDIDVSYTLTVNQGENLESYMDFENVKTSQITLSNLSVVIHGIPVIGDLELMEDTEAVVLEATNYFANGVGLIKSETAVDIPFIDLLEMMPVPIDGIPDLQEINFHVTQDLTEYSVN